MRQEEAMHRVVKAWQAIWAGLSTEELVDRMVARWEEYQAAIPELEWAFGSSYKFFMSGNWDKPETWPKGSATAVEAAFVSGGPDD